MERSELRRRRPGTREDGTTPALTSAEALLRAAAARVGVLATMRPDGRAHQVPVAFALEGNLLYTAVDHKPKSTRELTRLDNIAHNPAVSVLVHHYEDNWDALWWCRLDGHAETHEGGEWLAKTQALLASKYSQYEAHPPEGPAIVVTVEEIAGWSAVSG